MQEERLQLSIGADDSEARPVQERWNKFQDSAEAGAKKLKTAAVDAFGSMAQGLMHLAEGLERAETAKTAFELLMVSIKAGTTVVAAHATTVDGLMQIYRTARVVLSPTPFTLITIAAGIAIENTVKLMKAQAELVRQQSVMAGLNKNYVSQGSVAMIGAAGGQDKAKEYLGLYNDLLDSSGKLKSSVTDQFGTSATSPFFDRKAPDMLRDVAANLSAIKDPAERARAAVAVFGDDASKALSMLDERFVKNADRAREWALTLSPEASQNLLDFQRDMGALGRSLDDVGGYFEGLKKKVKLEITEMGAATYGYFKQVFELQDKLQELGSGTVFGPKTRGNLQSYGETAGDFQANAVSPIEYLSVFGGPAAMGGVLAGEGAGYYSGSGGSFNRYDQIQKQRMEAILRNQDFTSMFRGSAKDTELSLLGGTDALAGQAQSVLGRTTSADLTRQLGDRSLTSSKQGLITLGHSMDDVKAQLQTTRGKYDEIRKIVTDIVKLPDGTSGTLFSKMSPAGQKEIIESALSYKSQIDGLEQLTDRAQQSIARSKSLISDRLAQNKASQSFYQSSLGFDSVARITQQTAQFTQEQTTRSDDQGEYRIKLSAQNRLLIEQGLQAQIRAEQRKTVDEYLKDQEAAFRQHESMFEQQMQREGQFNDTTAQMRLATAEQGLDYEKTALDQSHQLQLSQLDALNATTLQGKLKVERQKLAIEVRLSAAVRAAGDREGPATGRTRSYYPPGGCRRSPHYRAAVCGPIGCNQRAADPATRSALSHHVGTAPERDAAASGSIDAPGAGSHEAGLRLDQAICRRDLRCFDYAIAGCLLADRQLFQTDHPHRD
jgi:hypothetical protein